MIARACAKHADATIPALTFAASGTAGGNTFVDWMPDEPDTAVAFMTGQPQPQLTKAATDLPMVQAIVRARKASDAEALAQQVYAEFTCLPRCVLDEGGPDEAHLIGCTAIQSGPVSMGRDPKDRAEFSLNFALRVHAPTTYRPGGS